MLMLAHATCTVHMCVDSDSYVLHLQALLNMWYKSYLHSSDTVALICVCTILFHAAGGSDFSIGSLSATFPAGMLGEACIDVTVIDDDEYEGEHDFSVHINEVTPTLTLSPPSYLSITIVDPEGLFAYVWCFYNL